MGFFSSLFGGMSVEDVSDWDEEEIREALEDEGYDPATIAEFLSGDIDAEDLEDEGSW